MKWLKIHVTRESHTEVYVQVPDDFDLRDVRREKTLKQIQKIADETTEPGDWDTNGWEQTVRVVDAESVSEEEARDFAWGKLIDGGGTGG